MDTTSTMPIGAGAIDAALGQAIEQTLGQADPNPNPPADQPAAEDGDSDQSQAQPQPEAERQKTKAELEREKARARAEELKKFREMARDNEPEPEPDPEPEPEPEPESDDESEYDDGFYSGVPDDTRRDVKRWSSEGKIKREDRLARVGILFRRNPEERGKMFVSGEVSRFAIMLAYVGPEDSPEEELAWAGSVIRFYPPQWDEERGMYTCALRTVEAYRCHCETCNGGKGATYTMDARTAITWAERISGFRMKEGLHAVHAMVSLGNTCPRCKKNGLVEWHQFDPLGKDANEVFGGDEVDAFRDAILHAGGDLDLPPVIGYVSNGTPGCLDDLPDVKSLEKVLNKAANKVAGDGMQILDVGSIGRRDVFTKDGRLLKTIDDVVEGWDLVLTDHMLVGTEVAGKLDKGICIPDPNSNGRGKDDEDDDEISFSFDLKIPLNCAWRRERKFIPTIDCWARPGSNGVSQQRRRHGGKTRGGRQGGYHA